MSLSDSEEATPHPHSPRGEAYCFHAILQERKHVYLGREDVL